MVGRRIVQDDVLDHDQQSLALSRKAPCQRLLTYDINQSFADPGPELLLSRPELVFVGTNYPGGLFYLHKGLSVFAFRASVARCFPDLRAGWILF